MPASHLAIDEGLDSLLQSGTFSEGAHRRQTLHQFSHLVEQKRNKNTTTEKMKARRK
jgi:hypothetical protein